MYCQRFPGCDIAILAAAVADFTPERVEERKIKRTGEEIYSQAETYKRYRRTLGGMKKKISDTCRICP